MNKLLCLISILLFFSCSNTTKTNSTEELPAVTVVIPHENSNKDSELNYPVEQSLETTEFVEDDCIFDQANQTDEFLIGIKEFKNYTWDSISKTATIALNNKNTISITRGGCYHFGVSAELTLYNDTTDYYNWENVNQKILWISKILSSEFAYEAIKVEIDSSKQIIDNDYGYFSSEYLQDNNYEFARRIEKDLTTITLSYYLN